MRQATKMAMITRRSGGNDEEYGRMPRGGTYYTDMPMYPENAFRDRNGDRHYNNGRYAPEPGAYMDPYMNDVPPRYEIGFNSRMGGGADTTRYDFDVQGTMDRQNVIGMPQHSGTTNRARAEKLTKEDAKHWVSKMRNGDGTTGEHWTMEQAKQIQESRNINCDPAEFYAVLNMMYSDYAAIAQRYGAAIEDFCANMARMFINDKDAPEGKVRLYYTMMQ